FRATIQHVIDLAREAAEPAGAQKSAISSVNGGSAVVRPPDTETTITDSSLALPFAYRPQQDKSERAIAAVFHIFYDEVAEDLLRYANNLPAGTDIFVSTDTQTKADRITAVFEGYHGGNVTVRIVPNRGRDIAPKLIGF